MEVHQTVFVEQLFTELGQRMIQMCIRDRDFIYDRLKPFCEKELGIKFTILHADKTYDDVFHHVITRGPHKGVVRGFAWAGMCAVNRDCKIPPVRKYNAALSPGTVSYVGIAQDEPKRLARLDSVKKVSLLAKYGMTEADAYKLCQDHGLLSPIYAHCRRNGCWFCPNASDSELLHMVTKHPDMFDRLIEWEKEDNIFHRRMTRRETDVYKRQRLRRCPFRSGEEADRHAEEKGQEGKESPQVRPADHPLCGCLLYTSHFAPAVNLKSCSVWWAVREPGNPPFSGCWQ